VPKGNRLLGDIAANRCSRISTDESKARPLEVHPPPREQPAISVVVRLALTIRRI